MANDSFDPSLPRLQSSLWGWTRQQDPASELYKVLGTLGDKIDDLGDAFDLIWQSRSIATANQDDLIGQYGYVWGVQQEQLPPTITQLSAYMLARSEEDGTVPSLVNTLLSLVDPSTFGGGAVLTFPSNGSGLVFPNAAGTSGLVWPSSGAGFTFAPDGSGISFTGQPSSGLTLYQYAAGAQPAAGLVFPANGSGLHFPVLPQLGSDPDQALGMDGTIGATQIGSGAGQLPLTFANNPFVTIVENWPSFTVQVKSYLNFDRGAFGRAVERFQPAHMLPGTIVEINTT